MALHRCITIIIPRKTALFSAFDFRQGFSSASSIYGGNHTYELFDQLIGETDKARSSKLVPDRSYVALCSAFCKEYAKLFDDDQSTSNAIRSEILRRMIKHGSYSKNSIVSSMQNCINIQDEVAFYSQFDRLLQTNLIPSYAGLLETISQQQFGVKSICRMRADLMNLDAYEGDIHSKLLKNFLTRLLNRLFNNDLLEVKRVSWSNSSCNLVEKIAKYEAVREFSGWQDAKRRLGPYRRCFALMHPVLPDEPLVTLFVALMDRISSNSDEILKQNIDPETGEEADSITAAIFYGISSTQKGLQGIDLGNIMIKRVAAQLKRDFPHLNTFCTLSPIPLFSKWLFNKLEGMEQNPDMSEFPFNSSQFKRDFIGGIRDFRLRLMADDWTKNPETMQHLLIPLCARYLFEAKRDNYAYDPVCNFHLKNGACIYRLNWMADMSPKFLKQSFGIMVNYSYSMDECDKNSDQYLSSGLINSSDIFREQLSTSA